MSKLDFIDTYKCYEIICSHCECLSECNGQEGIVSKEDAWKDFKQRGWVIRKGYILCPECVWKQQE